MNCVSCHNVHDEKYYPNCGEKSGIQRITLRSMIEDTFSSITNMDRGFLYNLKTLTLNPKKITLLMPHHPTGAALPVFLHSQKSNIVASNSSRTKAP